MKKRVVAILMAGAMVASCLTGCGGDSKKNKGGTSETDVEISYWSSGLGTEWLDNLIKAFKEVHPEYNVYYTATADSSAVGSALGMEDVDTVDLYLGMTSSKTGALEPLDDVLDTTVEGESKSIREKFNQGYLDLVKETDGKTYNLTYGGGIISFVYNTKIFKEAGITQLPRTTDEFAVVCDTLQKKKNIVPLCHFTGGGYYDFLSEAYFMQYDGKDYYLNNFYACKDENGKSPSKDVFTKKDGRYETIKAYEKFITPDTVLQGSNSTPHVNMQTMFVNEKCAMMASGSWMVNEMKGNGNLSDFDMMRLPVLSAITDKLDTVKRESDLRKVIDAIDAVTDGVKAESDYKKGDAYEVDGIKVSAKDWEYIYNARNTIATNFSGESAFIPKYSNAKEGAKEFLKFMYSDAGYKTYAEGSHFVLPMSLSEGALDTAKWSDFEKNQYKYLISGTQYASYYNRSKHPIFDNGGAASFANVSFINYLCTINDKDRLSADDIWNKMLEEINNNYESTWLANIK